MYETKFMKRVLELSQQGMQTGHGGPLAAWSSGRDHRRRSAQ